MNGIKRFAQKNMDMEGSRMIKKFLKNLEFYFPGCDATLDGFEFLGALALGIAICAAPFVIKWILIAVHFGGV